MKKIEKNDFTLLFDSKKTLSKQEMESIKGGEVCGNIYLGYYHIPGTCTTFYIGVQQQ